MRTLICSPVRQKPHILTAFLDGLDWLDRRGADVDFLFIDDCDNPEASSILRSWRPSVGSVDVIQPIGLPEYEYVQGEDFHHWHAGLARKVGVMRDKLLADTVAGEYDNCLLVDSDLVLRPNTLKWLYAAEKDIVSEVFWTRFYLNNWVVPNCWLWGECGFVKVYPDEMPDDTEMKRRTRAWLKELKAPGLYPVGGLGACTLISRQAIEDGCRYEPVPNLGWWGEDRHFCVRAAVNGFGLWVDTHCAPLHLYRQEYVDRLPAFTAKYGRRKGVA